MTAFGAYSFSPNTVDLRHPAWGLCVDPCKTSCGGSSDGRQSCPASQGGADQRSRDPWGSDENRADGLDRDGAERNCPPEPEASIVAGEPHGLLRDSAGAVWASVLRRGSALPVRRCSLAA